jgi:surface antigen
VSLRSRLRAPLIAAVSTALVGGLVAFAPTPAVAAPRSDPPPSKAAMVAREKRAAADGLTRSRAVFARSSYLCVGYKACGQAGMGSGGYAAVNDKMYWRMYSGHNCTNYAAYRMVHSGLPNQRPWSGGGNATYWGTSVPSLTDRTPAVGAVAWWKANTGPAGSAGHVAYVEKVVDSDEIIISQDSWGGDFSWAVVTKASGNWPSGFIHFNDLKLVNKAAPVVSGVAKVGATLTASAGTWSPTDAKVSYQWFANGAAIPQATKSTLPLTGSLLGDVI